MLALEPEAVDGSRRHPPAPAGIGRHTPAMLPELSSTTMTRLSKGLRVISSEEYVADR